MKYFLRLVYPLAALLVGSACAFGQGAIDGGAVMVQVRGSYITNTGLGAPLLTVSYTPDAADAAELEFRSTAQTATTGATAEKSILLPVAKVFRIVATAANVEKYQVSLAVPRGYQVTIDGITHDAASREGNRDAAKNPIPGSVDGFFEVCITRISRPYVAASASGVGQLGDATSISWSEPGLSPPSIPWMEFNLGDGLNGAPLPPLHLMMSNLNRSSEFILWTAPWNFEAYENSVADVNLEYLGNGDMRLRAPQVTVEYVLKPQPGSVGNDVADFELRFYEPGDPATLAPFVVYSIHFDWSFTNASTRTGIRYKNVTVTKTVGSVTYSTALKTDETVSPYAWTLDFLKGTWTLEDWHRGSTIPGTVKVARAETVYNPGGSNQYSTFSDAISVYESNPAAAVTRRTVNYQLVRIPYPEIAVNYTAHIQATSTVIAGSGSNQYTSRVLLDPRNRRLGGIDPSGFISVAQYTGSGATLRPKTYFRPYQSNTPSVDQTTFAISPNGGEATDFLYANDWNDAPILPTSIRRWQGRTASASGTLASESTLEHVYETTPIPGSSDGYPILKSTRYDFESASTQTVDPNSPRSPSDGNSLRTITKTYREDASNQLLRGRPHSIERPDGTKVSFLYETGTYVPGGDHNNFANSNGTDFRITAFHGAQAAPLAGNVDLTSVLSNGVSVSIDAVRLVPLKSTKTIEVLRRGMVICREVYVCATATPTWERISWEAFGYAPNGELTSRSNSNNTSYAMQWSANRDKQTVTDETGTITTITFDAAGRTASVDFAANGIQVPARSISYVYDADGRVTESRQGPVNDPQSPPIVTKWEYNDAGDLTLETAPGGIKTKFEYPNSGRDLKVTYHSGTTKQSTKEITRHTDGRTQDVAGSAVIEEHFAYDFIDGKARITHRLADQKRPSRIIYDLLGRVVRESADGFGGAGTLQTYHAYDKRGRRSSSITKQEGIGAAFRISGELRMEYDEFSQPLRVGLNLDGKVTGQGTDNEIWLHAGSTDRFTSFETKFYNDGAAWWRRTTTKHYHTDGSDEAYETISQVRVGDMPATDVLSQAMNSDFHGRETWETLKRSTSSRTRSLSILQPDKTTLLVKMSQGLVLDECTFNSGNQSQANPPDLATSYYYDAQGRMVQAVDLRTSGEPRIVYHDGTARPWKIYDPRGTLIATHTYDDAGRLESTTTPATAVAPASTLSRTYTLRGELEQLSGSGTQPRQMSYSAFGEMTALRTYRTGLAGTADETTWKYDDSTGWLEEKTDAQAQKVKYGYQFLSSGYRDVTRTWARSTAEKPATTRYRYQLSTGELESVDYSDVKTADLAYTYTRSGLPKTITDASGTRVLAYDKEQLTTETLSGYFGGLIIANSYEQSTDVGQNKLTGRYSGFQLGVASNPDREMATTYGYDHLGRVAKVTADYEGRGTLRSALSVPATYSYKSASSMWEKLTQGDYSIERKFEPNRDVLTNVQNKHVTGSMVTFVGYKTDDQGRLESRLQWGMAFNDAMDTENDPTYQRYDYDASGQLTSSIGYRGTNPGAAGSALPGRGFSYGYDDAGNRKAVGVSGDQVSYRSGPNTSDPVGANSLNQAGSRGTLLTRVSGTSHAEANVTIGSQIARREAMPGRYWDLAFPGYAQNTSATVSAALPSQTAQSAEVPITTRAAHEILTYDKDGNLESDSQWLYEWDGENRLRRMTKNPAASWAPDRELTFTYDYLGRRIQKVYKQGNTVVSDRRYLYHGWNLIAEIDPSSGYVVRSYVWGLDMASSLTATGGVGALVLQTIHTETSLDSFHVAYDGQGNVVALVNRKPGNPEDGAVAAAYEYGPFGEIVRANVDRDVSQPLRDALAAQPFRFSTKFTDVETGLIYYGLRYYDPSQGRFISRDPIGEDGGANLYGFVGNQPNNRIDVLGLADAGAATGGTRGNPETPPPEPPPRDPRGLLSSRVGFVGFMYLSPDFRRAEGDAAQAKAEEAVRNKTYSDWQTPGGEAVLNRLRVRGEPCIRCHGVDAEGFHGDPTDFRGVIGGMPAEYFTWETRAVSQVGPRILLGGTISIATVFVPGVGEAVAVYVVFDPDAAAWEKGVAIATLGVSGTVRVLRLIPTSSVEAAPLMRQLEQQHMSKSLGELIPNEALVVRGGVNTPELVAQGIGTHPSAGVTGVSVESAIGKTAAELAAGPPPIPNGKIGVTTAGAVRAAGGDVVRTSGVRPNHATLTGLTAEQISKLLQPPIKNPAKSN